MIQKSNKTLCPFRFGRHVNREKEANTEPIENQLRPFETNWDQLRPGWEPVETIWDSGNVGGQVGDAVCEKGDHYICDSLIRSPSLNLIQTRIKLIGKSENYWCWEGKLRKCTSIIRWLNFPWIEAKSQIDQSCTAMQPTMLMMMTMMMMMLVMMMIEVMMTVTMMYVVAAKKEAKGQLLLLLGFLSNAIDWTDTLLMRWWRRGRCWRWRWCSCPFPSGSPRRWAWLMPWRGVESFRVGQKPAAYREQPEQGDRADSREDKFPECESRILRSPAKKNGRGWRLVEQGGATLRENWGRNLISSQAKNISSQAQNISFQAKNISSHAQNISSGTKCGSKSNIYFFSLQS